MAKLIDQLTMNEIVALYNQLTKNPVKKFRDRSTGETRLLSLEVGKSREQMLAAAMAANVRKPIIQQWSYLKGPEVDLEAKPDMIVTRAQKLQQEKKERKASRPVTPPVPINKLAGALVAVLRGLRDMIPEGSTGDAAQVNSTDLAKRLQTSVNFICKSADALEKLKLVGVEDDSPNDDVKFYYISLTEAGRNLDLSGVEVRPPAEKKEKPIKVPREKLPNSSPGPNSSSNGKLLFKKVEKNPRREGTHGFNSFSLIKDGMTYEAFRTAGGRANDLAWDVEHGYVELRDK